MLLNGLKINHMKNTATLLLVLASLFGAAQMTKLTDEYFGVGYYITIDESPQENLVSIFGNRQVGIDVTSLGDDSDMAIQLSGEQVKEVSAVVLESYKDLEFNKLRSREVGPIIVTFVQGGNISVDIHATLVITSFKMDGKDLVLLAVHDLISTDGATSKGGVRALTGVEEVLLFLGAIKEK